MDADLKRYYQDVQSYDWTRAAASFSPEGVFHRLRARAALAAISRHGAPPYLDLGCGTGLITRRLPAGTVAADVNPRNLALLARYAPEARPLLADAEALPVADGSARTVVLTEVLEHFPDPRPLLAEIRRVLAPGGALIGTTPRAGLLWRLRFLSWSCVGREVEPFHREFTEEDLRSVLAPSFPSVAIAPAVFGASFLFVCRAP